MTYLYIQIYAFSLPYSIIVSFNSNEILIKRFSPNWSAESRWTKLNLLLQFTVKVYQHLWIHSVHPSRQNFWVWILRTVVKLDFEAINMPYKEPNPGDEIVISGISGVYPQCENISVLAQKLFDKEDLISGKLLIKVFR